MNCQKRIVEDCVCIVLMVIVGISFFYFAPYIMSIAGDGGDGHYAIWAANAKILHEGDLPLWNPYIWGGYGDVGHIHEVFYPILLLLEYLFWDIETQTLSYAVFPAYTAIHMCIASVGMYFLLRKRDHSYMVSFFVAELVALSGCFTFGMTWAYIFGSYCWMPWLLFTLYSLVKYRTRIWIALSGIILGMIGLCSTAHGALFAVLIYVLIYGTLIWTKKEDIKDCVKLTGQFLLSGFIGMALASVQLFPFLETTINSFRYVPGVDMSESTGKLSLSVFKEDVVDSTNIMGVFGSYYGVAAISVVLLLLIILSFFIKRKKDWFITFSQMLLFGAFFYAIGFGVADLFWYIPGFNAIREPILYAPFMVLAGGILAANALEEIVDVLRPENQGKLSERLTNKSLCGWILLFACSICFLPHLVQGKADFFIKVMVVFFVVILVKGKKMQKILVNCALILIVALNLCQFAEINTSVGVYSAKTGMEKVDLVNQTTQNLLDELDVKIEDGEDSTARYLKWSETDVLPANVAGAIGEKDCFAYLNPIYEKNFFVYQMMDISKKIQLQNIKYVLLGEDCNEEFVTWLETTVGDESVVAETEVYASYDAAETKKVRYIDTSDLNLGCGWVVNDIHEYAGSVEAGDVNTAQEFIGKINDVEFDLRKSVYVDTEKALHIREWDLNSTDNIEYNVKCTADNANSMTYNVITSDNGVFVTSEFYYPGWKVYVDGQEAEILQVNYAFRGVYLEEGTHEIEFCYEPFSLKFGATLSILSMMILIYLFTTSVKGRKVSNV